MDDLNVMRQVADDPLAYARGLKQQGQRIIGYFCSYAPEEIIHAGGLHPMRLFGTRGEILRAEEHLQAYCCSLVRGALEEGLTGRLDFLDGTVFPHTCDSIQRLSDIWRMNTDLSFFADVVLPVKLNTQSSRTYLEEVLVRFRCELQQWLGRVISDEDLRASISTYNDLRTSLKSIYLARAHNPTLIGGSSLAAVVKAALVMDRAEARERLSRIAASLGRGGQATGTASGKRLVLVGSVCDHPDIYDIIERSGGVVVWDDLCSGTRTFEGLIDEDSDNPLGAIAHRYASRLVCPAKHLSPAARGEELTRIARDCQADGVVFVLLKFCDPHAFDYPYLKETLASEGIASMLLEIEDRLPAEGQLLTRFETFMHML